jgi:hypothetical protein
MQPITTDLNEAQRRAADAWPSRRGGVHACTANRCSSGDKPCPCPDACRLPARQGRDYIGARCGLALLIVSSIVMVSGALHLAALMGWLQ